MSSSGLRDSEEDVSVSFSHVHLYVDAVDDVKSYKSLEGRLNRFAEAEAEARGEGRGGEDGDGRFAPSSSSGGGGGGESLDVAKCRRIWRSLDGGDGSERRDGSDDDDDEAPDGTFVTQNRDVVRQLIAGFGFRVTGSRMSDDLGTGVDDREVVVVNTRSVLVTSPDPDGVQIVVTALDPKCEEGSSGVDECRHFDAANLRRFFREHSGRQGVAALAFEVSVGSIETIRGRYASMHPKLLSLDDGKVRHYDDADVLEVFAYYRGDKCSTEADRGTVLRFVQPKRGGGVGHGGCKLPGLSPAGDAAFDGTSRPAYCDHWVSNVVSRTGFLDTLRDVLGFAPKVDFNAGVVAAGEAQIESTVTGNTSEFSSANPMEALRDQSQVYLPINNALSPVGHVHGFIEEIGQGVQHVASRVEDLAAFVQRANDYRKITGEGFTFLNIPRSYYGVLTAKQLVEGTPPTDDDDGETPNREEGEEGGGGTSPATSPLLSPGCAEAVVNACERCGVTTHDGAVDLELTADDVAARVDGAMSDGTAVRAHRDEYRSNREAVVRCILRSRYSNLYSLLRHHLSERSYVAIVRNQILVDVQGDDLLFQIFTSNMLQRKSGEEAPFFEFIQRVCSECVAQDGCPARVKPGCGGFGIRNFLTLFLSIEVSKAMAEAKRARACGDDAKLEYAQRMVDTFTDQLNEANPILTEISDAMTAEGHAAGEVNAALERGDERAAAMWEERVRSYASAKNEGNKKLMACSTKYKVLMKRLRDEC